MPGNAPQSAAQKEAQDVLQRIKQVDADNGHLTTRDFTTSTGTPNSRTVVAEVKQNRPVAIRGSKPFDLSLMAKETFTTDATAGNTETFNLANDLLAESAVGENFVLFENNTRVSADAVDPSTDSFDYTDDATGNTLTAFYAAGDQALVSIQKVAPNGTPEELFSGDIGNIHRRDHNERPLKLDANRSPFQPIIPTDYDLEIAVNAPYTTAFTADPNGDGTEVSASNALVDVPVKGAPSEIPGLASTVRNDMARR